MAKKLNNNNNQELTLQVVTPVATPKQSNKFGISSRTFETRFEPRYKEMPEVPNDLETPTFSESANKILKERYLLKGGNLEVVESISERFWHISYDIASGDFDFDASKKEVFNLAKDFYGMMVRQEFLPNSPTIMNAGKQNHQQYSACFVLPVEDSLPGIFDAIKHAALIHQSGGGTGFAFSRLRAQGSPVHSTGGVASGPISFLRVFNAATNAIKQGGTRRGANMGILRVDHPDIFDFIRCKAELDEDHKPVFDEIAPFLPNDNVRDYFKRLMLDRQISNFNISVAITDKFMDAYYKDGDYELIDPATKEVKGKLKARDVFDEIIDRAWHTGDPGLVFIDRINNSPANPVPSLEEIEATNPCGEQPLFGYDACNLGSINLGKFVSDDVAEIDWDGLRETTRKAVHFLDNVVQTNPYTLEQIYDEVHKNRRIGLGVMGWADMLFKMKIAYNSEEALRLAEEVMKFIDHEGHKMSEELAEKRGPFANWAHSIYADKKPLRNSTVTTIAPTGTISIIGDCSSGIEPVFALAYVHKAKTVGDQYRYLTIANQTFEAIAKKNNFYSDDLGEKVMQQGSVSGVDDVPSDWKKIFITAPEIDPEWHVRMQAAFQKYTCNGVSKTINLPNSATIEDIKNSYLLSWETGCKGITVYRDGSKTVQVLNVSSTLSPKAEEAKEVVKDGPQAQVVARPMILRGRTYKMLTPVGEAFITINRDESDQPFEVFVTIGKAGMQTSADAEALGRLVSLSLRLGRKTNTVEEITKKIVAQLRGIGGSSQVGFGKDRVMSLADAIAKVLAEDLTHSQSEAAVSEPQPLPLTVESVEAPRDDVVKSNMASVASNVDICPECGAVAFAFEEGCKKCHACGYSMC